MHLISFHSITISLELENIFSILLLPGTIIEVIVPLSKSAHTSCTNPSLLPSFMFITSLCLKSKPLFPSHLHFLSYNISYA